MSRGGENVVQGGEHVVPVFKLVCRSFTKQNATTIIFSLTVTDIMFFLFFLGNRFEDACNSDTERRNTGFHAGTPPPPNLP